MTGTLAVPPGCTEGTGNSPPARKAAVSPESATRSGSARRRMRPFVSSALRRRSMLAPLLARLASATPKGAAPESKVPTVEKIGMPGAPLPAGEPGAGTGFPPASTTSRPRAAPGRRAPPAQRGVTPDPVLTPRFPPLFAPNQFTPISRLALRATSRNRTLSMTCCAGATFIAFTILPPSGSMLFATVTARSAATALPATPLSTIWPLLLPTRMPPLPVLARIWFWRLPVSSATSTSSTPISFMP